MTAARKLSEGTLGIELVSGVVLPGDGVRVRIGGESFDAVRAKSCLVAPEAGDRVLCAVEPGAVFVLAVLTGGEATRVTAEGALSIEAPHIAVRADESTVTVGKLGFFAGLVDAHAQKLAVLADDIDTIATRIAQKAKRAFRLVEEVDQLRAGTVDVRAENLATIRAENALISARVLAKIDGEQINLG
jgi:hypothetical protein